MEEVLEENKRCAISFTGDDWRNLSLEARDLVTRMLDRDPLLRPTAKDCLQHAWMDMQLANLSTLTRALNININFNLVLSAE